MKTTRWNNLRQLERLESRVNPGATDPFTERTLGGAFADRLNGYPFNYFSESDLGTTLNTIPFTGLDGSEDIEATDVRPNDGNLYGLGVAVNTGRVLKLDLAAGTATQVGSSFSVSGNDFGMDFDPTTDLLRIVSDADENISFNPTTGVATVLPDLNPASSSVVAIAFTNNFPGATSTTLFGIDTAGNLFSSIDPATGLVTPIGSLAVNPNGSIGFDIASDGTAYAALNFVSGPTRIYTLDIADRGQPTLIGEVDPATPIATLATFGEVWGPNRRTSNFKDVDGDIVTVKITKGLLDATKLQLLPASGGFHLRSLDLTDPQFAGSNVMITAKPGPTGGDGFVNVGAILAGINNLGTVTVDGDLGQIDAGNPANTATQPGVKSLTVQSMGMYGLSTQTGGDLVSDIKGALPRLKVKGDIRGEYLSITGNLGIAKIAGSLIGGTVADSGSIHAATFGSVSIGDSIVGGDGNFSGRLVSDGNLGSLTVGHDIRSGSGVLSGSVASNKAIGTMTIKGSLIGTATSKVRILGRDAMGKLTVNGRVEFAQILAGYDSIGTPVNGDAQISKVTIGRDWIASDLVAGVAEGGNGKFGDAGDVSIPGGDANIQSKISSITIKGQALGTVGGTDQFGFVSQQIGSLKVGGTTVAMTAGTGNDLTELFVGVTGDFGVLEVAI